MTSFADDLAKLVSKEAAAGKNDPDRMAAMVERLAAALGFTVALACRGDPRAVDEMLAGADAHAHAEAVEKSTLFRLMGLRSPRRGELNPPPNLEGK